MLLISKTLLVARRKCPSKADYHFETSQYHEVSSTFVDILYVVLCMSDMYLDSQIYSLSMRPPCAVHTHLSLWRSMCQLFPFPHRTESYKCRLLLLGVSRLKRWQIVSSFINGFSWPLLASPGLHQRPYIIETMHSYTLPM